MAAISTPLPRLSEESEESFDLNVPPETFEARHDSASESTTKHSSSDLRREHESSDSSRPTSSKQSNLSTYNFSRPRPTRINSGPSPQLYKPPTTSSSVSYRPLSSPSEKGRVHAISAFHDSHTDLTSFPDEPRLSSESDRTTTGSSITSADSVLTWDSNRGELRSRRPPPKNYERQRFERDVRPLSDRSNSSSSRSSSTTTSGSSIPLKKQATNSSERHIMKRISLDQQSERMSITTDGHEDTASHHTVSEDGDADSGPCDMEGNWQSSSYDTSGLSDAQIKKLLKKGINPSLYAEMKAARKGKSKLIPPLLGNSFLG